MGSMDDTLAMRTFTTLRHERKHDLPPTLDADVVMPESFVEHFLGEFTDRGDAVLDPFAGFGTTLAVAESMGRVPYGVEYEADRAEYVRDRVDHPDNVVHGDALELSAYDLPTVDCCLTSPPFMVCGMETNPFENYDSESDYESYLDDVRRAFSELGSVLSPGASVLVNVVNVKYDGDVTPLAWDVADAVSEVLHFDGEIVVTWEGEGSPDREGAFGYGYDHSYCLVFRKEA